ncbi:MAG: hypothetical protein H0A75_00120 [Candidatus Methanofishera endochildressiae]|uniref:Uncharacterized protein n=1 Tax=Candidatus Methanofishera endochildressiae TaxID=2738884 RepID=A0A7Z0MMC3_9GAMM|nr:hypothetical protein [Candidatus Methanofishera endochildressiae]
MTQRPDGGPGGLANEQIAVDSNDRDINFKPQKMTEQGKGNSPSSGMVF